MKYIRLAEGFTNYKLIPETDNIWNHITSNNKDYYTSLYRYPEEHYNNWKKTGSVSGITGLTTKTLFFDMDNKSNIEAARQDALTVVGRLIESGIPQDNIQVAFSGQKGFSVAVETNQDFTKDEFVSVTTALAGDLTSFDRVVKDDQRIIRVVGTKHHKSGLYKIPLTLTQLSDLSIDSIKKLASNLDDVDDSIMDNWVQVELPPTIQKLKTVKVDNKKVDTIVHDLDMTLKPKFLTEAKYALQMGYFGEGERNNAFMILCATYKAQGFPKEITYRMLKGVAEIQAKRNNQDPYSNNEIWSNIVKPVYSPEWKGATYAYETTELLQLVTKRLGLKEPKAESPIIMSDLGGDSFKRYAQSFYETRIYTGLKQLDDAFPICAGSNVAIVGAASSGKTALSLNILSQMKESGGISIFASLDMAKSRLYEKMLYKVTGGEKTRDEIYNDYLEGKGGKYDEMVKEAFPNTYIFSKSAPTVDELKRYIDKVQDHTGKPVRLLLTDYFERLGSDRSDETAASKDVAAGIQDLISDYPELTPITLYQPNKFSMGGGPDKPILNYTAIKGSSFIIQSARQILSLWRPFFTPEFKNYDRFMEMAILKNDLGELDKFVFGWRGKTGAIYEPDSSELNNYEQYMKEKEASESKPKYQDDI